MVVKLDELTEVVVRRGEATVEVAEADSEVVGNVGLPLAEGGGVGVILPTVGDICNDIVTFIMISVYSGCYSIH